MQAMQLSAPGGLDQLQLNEMTPRAPGLGEVQVEVKASSLNFHDYAVVIGNDSPQRMAVFRCPMGRVSSRRWARASPIMRWAIGC